MKRNRGFTLVELMIVIIIIIIMAGVAVALLNTFFRGQGVRQGQMVVASTFAQAKQLAADQRVMHFIVFWNAADGGKMEIHRDANADGIYETNIPPTASEPDPAVDGKTIDLPKYCNFVGSNTQGWIGFNPSGYCVYSSGFLQVQPAAFDAAMAGGGASSTGDLVIQVQNRPYKVCINIDKTAGKIRRWVFIAE